ncbi:MAG: peptide deformylase [Sulfurovum sp.]|nr:peptide deformylase [Sulfurovum sp.]
MVYDIVVYPDRRLKIVSEEVMVFDDNLHMLLDNMYETMIVKNGVGLAAIQIGISKRVLIVNIPIDSDENDAQSQPKDNTLEIINPIITYRSEEMKKFQEGCLSIPGFYEDIERHAMVTIEYQDRYGKKFTIEDDEFLAVALQHEMDHLDGKLFVEKLSYMKRKKFEKEWKKRDK